MSGRFTCCCRGCSRPSLAARRLRKASTAALFQGPTHSAGLTSSPFALRPPARLPACARLDSGWIHTATADADGQAVLSLLSPQGSLFKALLRQTSETSLLYEIAYEQLPVRCPPASILSRHALAPETDTDSP